MTGRPAVPYPDVLDVLRADLSSTRRQIAAEIDERKRQEAERTERLDMLSSRLVQLEQAIATLEAAAS